MVSTVLLDFFVLGSYTVQKMVIWKGFEFLTLGGGFLGVKNNSKNFGNKNILGCLAKF